MRRCLVALAALLAVTSAPAADVNTASQAELESVTGVGPTLSAAILDERRKGEFRNWNDLAKRVKGITGRSAKRLSAGGLTVNGVSLPATSGVRAPAN